MLVRRRKVGRRQTDCVSGKRQTRHMSDAYSEPSDPCFVTEIVNMLSSRLYPQKCVIDRAREFGSVDRRYRLWDLRYSRQDITFCGLDYGRPLGIGIASCH